MSNEDNDRKSVNPPHNRIRHELPAIIKARAFEKDAGSLETFYLLYPESRPASRDPRTEGRER